jgi:hypothetical protein
MGKLAYCFLGGAGGPESACKRERAPTCLGMPENGGRHDEHGQFRPAPGEVFGVGRFYDGHGYGHPRQVLVCQCGICNRWEAGQMYDEVKAIEVVQMWQGGESGGWWAGAVAILQPR